MGIRAAWRYKVRTNDGIGGEQARSRAHHRIEESGLGTVQLVEIHERVLMDKLFLTARRHSDRSGIFSDGGSFLTDGPSAL